MQASSEAPSLLAPSRPPAASLEKLAGPQCSEYCPKKMALETSRPAAPPMTEAALEAEARALWLQKKQSRYNVGHKKSPRAHAVREGVLLARFYFLILDLFFLPF